MKRILCGTLSLLLLLSLCACKKNADAVPGSTGDVEVPNEVTNPADPNYQGSDLRDPGDVSIPNYGDGQNPTGSEDESQGGSTITAPEDPGSTTTPTTPTVDTPLIKAQKEHPEATITADDSNKDNIIGDEPGALMVRGTLPVNYTTEDKAHSDDPKSFKICDVYSPQISYKSVDLLEEHTKEYRKTIADYFSEKCDYAYTYEEKDAAGGIIFGRKDSEEADPNNYIRMAIGKDGMQVLQYASTWNNLWAPDMSVEDWYKKTAKQINDLLGISITVEDLKCMRDMALTVEAKNNCATFGLPDDVESCNICMTVALIGEANEGMHVTALRCIL